MYVIQNLHWMILLVGGLVFFHELGHFLVAKACGIKVLKFSLGFGPRLFGLQRGETEYVVSLLPLGGYVKMLGETPGSEVSPEEAHRSFGAKSLLQRTAVVLAGPGFNFVLAFLVYCALFTGQRTFASTHLGIVGEGDPAWQAGLRPGDTITQLDGHVVSEFDELRDYISSHPGEELRVTYRRGSQELVAAIKPSLEDEANVFRERERRGRIGVSPHYVKPYVGVADSQSPAGKAGLATGDLVLAVNGQEVGAWHEVRAEVAKVVAGSPLVLRVKRGNDTREVTVVPEAPLPDVPLAYASAADTASAYTGLVSQDVLVEKVDANTPAARLGLVAGDRLLRLRITKPTGETAERAIAVWSVDLAAFHGLDARSHFDLTYQHGQQVITAPLRLEARSERDDLKNERTQYVFGAYNKNDLVDAYTFERWVNPLAAVVEAGRKVVEDATLIGAGITRMVQGRIPLNTLGGPIMLFVIAEKSAKSGLVAFLGVMAVISVNLGMLNLLPVPVLDGGHLVFFAMEAIRRRPPSLRTREVANLVGLALLLLLMVLVFKNDILRFVLG